MSQPYEPYPTQPEPLPPIQPSGHVAANAYQPLYNPVKDLTLSGTLSAAAAGIFALATVASAVTVGPFLESDAGELGATVALYGASALIGSLALLAGFVMTGIWLYQARKNTEAFAPEWRHARRAGWAWGGWVCPIVSLWFPFQVVRDVHRASYARAATPALIGWWWALWLVTLFLNRVGGRMIDSAVTDPDLVSGARGVSWVVAVVTVTAAVLWILVVRRITVAHDARLRGVAL